MPTALPSEKRFHDVEDDQGNSEADDIILPISSSNEIPFVNSGIYYHSFIGFTYTLQRSLSTHPHRLRRVSSPQLSADKELTTRL